MVFQSNTPIIDLLMQVEWLDQIIQPDAMGELQSSTQYGHLSPFTLGSKSPFQLKSPVLHRTVSERSSSRQTLITFAPVAR